jgi:hypothetical protein
MDFRNFLADMGKKPDGMSIDRINTNGNYEPKNCRWATTAEQNSNKRNNFILTYKGKTMSVKDWSLSTGINASTIRKRISSYGWTAEQALTIGAHQRYVVERMTCAKDKEYAAANPACVAK